MDKSWNKWLILLGIIVLIVTIFFLGGIGKARLVFLIFGFLSFFFGIINYTDWHNFIKLLISLILAVAVPAIVGIIFVITAP